MANMPLPTEAELQQKAQAAMIQQQIAQLASQAAQQRQMPPPGMNGASGPPRSPLAGPGPMMQ